MAITPVKPDTLLDIIKNRRSIRHYTNQPIDQHILDQLIEAARWAPSAGNLQPLEIIVVRDEDTKYALADAAGRQNFMIEAPIVFVMVANLPRTEAKYKHRGRNLYTIQDVAAATQNVLLLAHSLGIGSCWIGAFNEAEVSEICDLPDFTRPMVMISLGYPNEQPEARQRRDVHTFLHNNCWEG